MPAIGLVSWIICMAVGIPVVAGIVIYKIWKDGKEDREKDKEYWKTRCLDCDTTFSSASEKENHQPCPDKATWGKFFRYWLLRKKS